ncbi:fibrobacter succinogenes major paralogous domain-containing protein [candidate division KSB1 bacterium]
MKKITLILFILLINNLVIAQNSTKVYNRQHAGTGRAGLTSNMADVDIGTVTDIDGNTYKTIKIGDQWWMTENLRVTHFRNGVEIPNVTGNAEWMNLSSGAYCMWENNSTTAAVMGHIYNWYAVDDSRVLAPEGWHVPTDDEWKDLEMYLGMSRSEANDRGFRGTDEGGKLKEAGTAHWNSPNKGATNESGFTALPGGYRDDVDGEFKNIRNGIAFWSSSESNSVFAWYRSLRSSRSDIGRSHNYKRLGFFVRCVRDK